nr:hypothetical protein [Marinicella sp. W31]MDC2876924.1 hypothetical protein [Marinicella sp. W31]
MKLRLSGAALSAALLTSVAIPASAEPVFNRIAVFSVAENLPADVDAMSETSAEIIAASEDGTMLVYSDSPLEAVGLIDITDPRAPKPAGTIKLDGEPTSVAVSGAKPLSALTPRKAIRRLQASWGLSISHPRLLKPNAISAASPIRLPCLPMVRSLPSPSRMNAMKT